MEKLKAHNVARVAAVAFETPAGEAILAHLRVVFYDRLTFSRGMSTEEMLHNEGKRWLVHYLLTLVEQGKDGKKAPHEAIKSDEGGEQDV